ncbi:hypothetical protein ABIA30_001765 [Mycobacterium sp. MAA66]|uniref:glycosyltransferase family A protein n=1 Tax=Mycobacterium sp. MAA66 TaxID=3156297 RepID=UPI0035113566
MLAFITTLRHPVNTADYGRAEAFLQGTLASIANQSSDEYVTIVVGNQRPSFTLPDRTHFVEVDFPAPTGHRGPRTGMAPFIWDKGTKIGVGLAAARAFAPEYVMFVDSDDFVHRDIAAFTHANPGHDGWMIARGWMYSRSRNAYALRRNLFRICGSSFILPLEAYQVSPDLTIASTQHEIADAFGDDQMEEILAGHRYAVQWWRERGRMLEPLPFPGAVYQVDTGENHSGSMLLGPALPYRPHLLDDFGLHPSLPRGASLWSAFGLPAFRPDFRPRRPAFMRPLRPELVRPERN